MSTSQSKCHSKCSDFISFIERHILPRVFFMQRSSIELHSICQQYLLNHKSSSRTVPIRQHATAHPWVPVPWVTTSGVAWNKTDAVITRPISSVLCYWHRHQAESINLHASINKSVAISMSHNTEYPRGRHKGQEQRPCPRTSKMT